MIRDDFGLLILSHGRADNVKTIQSMKDCGYTGKWWIIIDNEDKQAEKYYQNYGKEHVIMFDKYKKSLEVDTCDIPRERNAVLYARETCFEVARSLNLTYFLELDDDYTSFVYRYERGKSLASSPIKSMDAILEEMIKFLDLSGAYVLAMSQGGDFIGGTGSAVWQGQLTRKCMNAFLCKTDRPFEFLGRMNDDVNLYASEGIKGKLFFTTALVTLIQPQTQANSGGLTDMYLTYGTYVKSFFSIIVAPSCVKIHELGLSDQTRRIHHRLDWEYCNPKIISSKFKKV